MNERKKIFKEKLYERTDGYYQKFLKNNELVDDKEGTDWHADFKLHEIP